MGKIKDLNIKNRTYYYFGDMIDIRKFESNLLKIDKKSPMVILQLKSLVILIVIVIMKIFIALILCI